MDLKEYCVLSKSWKNDVLVVIKIKIKAQEEAFDNLRSTLQLSLPGCRFPKAKASTRYVLNYVLYLGGFISYF
jgi:hypothetical protein